MFCFLRRKWKEVTASEQHQAESILSGFSSINSPSILTAVHDLVNDLSLLCVCCCCVFVSVSPSGCVDLGSVQWWSGTGLADDTRHGTRHTCDPASHDPGTGSSRCPPHHSCTPPLHTHTHTLNICPLKTCDEHMTASSNYSLCIWSYLKTRQRCATVNNSVIEMGNDQCALKQHVWCYKAFGWCHIC